MSALSITNPLPRLLTRLGAACCLLGLGLTASAGRGEDAGFVPLFDGKTLAGWEGKPEFWRVEDGVLVGETTAEKPTKGNTFLIWRAGQVDDFELELEYRITEKGNSGIQYRSQDFGDFVVGGYQGDFEGGTRSGAVASSASVANGSRSRPTARRRPASRSARPASSRR